MLKKIAFLSLVLIVFAMQANAGGFVVGNNKIENVDVTKNNSLIRQEEAIILMPPMDSSRKIKLISFEEFMNSKHKDVKTPVNNGKKSIIISDKDYKISGATSDTREEIKEEKIKLVKKPLIKNKPITIKKEKIQEVEEVKEEVEEVIVKEKSENIMVAKELYISYKSDKRTLLTKDAKESIKDLIEDINKNDYDVLVEAYAAGDEEMAKRVSLIRANIIKNNFKSHGISEDKIKISPLGSQVNVNQVRVFLVK